MSMMINWNSEVPNLSFWANRLSLPLDHETLAKHYIAAHKFLREIKTALVNDHGFKEAAEDTRLLFILEATGPPRSSTRVPNAKISLPYHVSSFFSPDRKLQWEMIFHSALFQNMRSSCAPLAKLFYLLQTLIPGMFLLVKQEMQPEGQWTTSRALPPPDWVDLNRVMLVEIFGSSHYKALYKAALNLQQAFRVTRS